VDEYELIFITSIILVHLLKVYQAPSALGQEQPHKIVEHHTLSQNLMTMNL